MSQSTPDPTTHAGPSQADPAPSSPAPERSPSFEERMERFGQEAGEAGKRIGEQAEAAGKRLAADPGLAAAGDAAARVWGLILLGVGMWFLADITLDMEMPRIAWGELWPVALILVGVVIVFRGVVRRSA